MTKQLEPLIPMEAFKKLVTAISRVPKEAVEKAEAERPKRKRKPQGTAGAKSRR